MQTPRSHVSIMSRSFDNGNKHLTLVLQFPVRRFCLNYTSYSTILKLKMLFKYKYT